MRIIPSVVAIVFSFVTFFRYTMSGSISTAANVLFKSKFTMSLDLAKLIATASAEEVCWCYLRFQGITRCLLQLTEKRFSSRLELTGGQWCAVFSTMEETWCIWYDETDPPYCIRLCRCSNSAHNIIYFVGTHGWYTNREHSGIHHELFGSYT